MAGPVFKNLKELLGKSAHRSVICGLRLPIISSRFFIGMNDIFAFSVLVALGFALYRRLGVPASSPMSV